MKTFIFWQNIISIHQAPFLSNLAENSEVILIVEKEMDQRRIMDGWEIPNLGKCHIYIEPNNKQINSIFGKQNAIHIFSGFRSYNLCSKAFDIALKRKLPIGIMSEPFNWIGIKGKLRYVRHLYFRYKYENKISFILAIGNKGRWCFEKTGFSKKKIFDWGYFTETATIPISDNLNNLPSLIYIGTLNKSKGILPLLSIIKKNEQVFSYFKIIGDGEYRTIIEDFVSKNPHKYTYHKNIPNSEIYKYLSNSDVCILPSIGKDGWGAVINEALMCGTPVITSDYCGGSALINGKRGKVFTIKEDNLESTLLSFMNELPYNNDYRIEIQQWSNKNISGEAAANYFLEVIDSVFNNKNKPEAPWIKNN